MKKTALALTLISALLFSAVAGNLVNLGTANPVIDSTWVNPPKDTKPPTISINSPNNNTAYAKNDISLIFNATISESKNAKFITDIYYETDWQKGNTSAYHLDMSTPDYIYDGSAITEFSYVKTLADVPEGNHSIHIVAAAWGSYAIDLHGYYFDIIGSALLNFTIDTTQPIISISSLENKTYETSDVLLNFTTNEPVSEIKYSLDGQENVTVSGNATLTGLLNGEHNVTVYATDEAGNVGASENIVFTVATPEPFPITLFITASGASLTVVGIGLLVYFKKRRR